MKQSMSVNDKSLFMGFSGRRYKGTKDDFDDFFGGRGRQGRMVSWNDC